MTTEPATYPGYRFPAEIITHAVWLYHVFSLGLRDIELILAERGITVTRESVRRWALRFGSNDGEAMRRGSRRGDGGGRWATGGTMSKTSGADGAFAHANGALVGRVAGGRLSSRRVGGFVWAAARAKTAPPPIARRVAERADEAPLSHGERPWPAPRRPAPPPSRSAPPRPSSATPLRARAAPVATGVARRRARRRR